MDKNVYAQLHKAFFTAQYNVKEEIMRDNKKSKTTGKSKNNTTSKSQSKTEKNCK